MTDYAFSTKPVANSESIVSGSSYRFTVLTDRLIRYEWAADGKFEDRASTFAINRDFPAPKFRVVGADNEDDDLEIITDHFHLSYDKKKFSTSGLMANFSGKITLWGAQWRYEKPSEFNLGGTARTLDEVNGRTDMGEGIMSKFGYATIDDSRSMLFDGNGWVSGRQNGSDNGERVDGYLFAYGHDYKAAIKAFYALSGKQPILPRYALGNWWSRYYAYQQDEYLQLMDSFRKHGVPLSVAVIDMDWHLVGDERVPHAGWTGYTWDDRYFPDPESFGRELHSRNLKITLNDHPHSGIHYHEDSYEEMANYLRHDTTHKAPILFDPTSPKFMEAYLKILHRNIEKIACDFWWIDWQQGEFSKVPGIDPLWMLNHFHFIDNEVHGQKPMIFSRYAGPGSHRYPVGFSGDSVTTWESLEFQPEFTNTASNIGYGWWSHDIGGHMLGGRDDELVTRWIQYGVFSPIMRLHSSNSRWHSKEPWVYRKESELVITKYMQFRHRMVPFLYTRNVMGSTEDEPLCQPMYWSFADYEEAYSVPNQYMFGFELLVAPIVKPRDKRTNLACVKAWLPPLHRHVDIFTGTVYDGDRALNLYRPLEEYPVLAYEGSIITLDGDLIPQNGCSNPSSFEVMVVVGRNGQASVLEDPVDDSAEAKNAAPESGERGSLIQYTQESGVLKAHVTGREWSFRFLALTSIPSDLKVLVDGQETTSAAKITIHAYPETPSMLVSVPAPPTSAEAGLLTSKDQSSKYTIEIHLGANPELSIIDHTARIEALLQDYQVPFDIKDQIWSIVEDADARVNNVYASGDGTQGRKISPVTVRIGRLMSLGLEEALVGPIAELLLADARSAA